MREDIKNEFVDALINGGYEQIKGQLAEGGKRRCATGVLCDIGVRHGILRSMSNGWAFSVGEHFESYVENLPPAELLEWAGLSYSQMGIMVQLNDAGCSFKQLADIIKNGKLIEAYEQLLNDRDRFHD